MPPRLAQLHRYGLTDTAPEEPFDRITRLAARGLGVPTTLVTLIEPHRQTFKSAVGLPEPVASARETPLSYSLCRYVVEDDDVLAIGDAHAHDRWRDHPAFRDFGFAAYLGVPLRAPDGTALGALCALDDAPRAWSEDDVQTLTELAAVLTDELELRETVRRLEEEERAHAAVQALTDASFDAITDVFFILGLDGRLLRWNRRMSEVSGYTNDELTGMNADLFFSDEDRPAIHEAILRVYQEGQAVVETAILTEDGRQIPYELNGTPLLDGEGRVAGVCGTARDIAERKASERVLRMRELRFRSFVEATAQVVWQADPAGTVTELSEAWSIFTGQTPEEIEGWGWADALHPEDQPRVVEEWTAHLASRTPYETEYRVRRHDGAYHWFSIRAVPVYDEDELVEWVGTCVDVENQKETAEALRLSEARHRGLIEANPDIFFRFSREGRYLDVRAQDAEDLLINEPAALLGRTISEFLPATEAAEWLDVIGAALDTRQLQRYEYELATVDGDSHHFEARVVPLGADEVQAIVRDITDRRRYELGLVQTIDAAEEARARAEEARLHVEEATRMKAALLANMSHEIRTPLTAIIGFAEILQEEAGDERGEFAQLIGTSGRRLLDTLNSVLDLAQIEARQFPLHPVEFDLALVAFDTAELLRPSAEAKGIALHCLLPDEPTRILADQTAFTRVVSNLVSNAVKFTDEGSVTVSTQILPSGAEAELRVEDTGVGIDEAFLPLLFDEFRQESEGQGRSYEGSGLGLSITKRLVDILGGTVAVESRKGDGSTFAIRLPLARR